MSELMLSKQTLIKLLERASPDPCEPYGCDPWEPPPGGTEPLPDPHPRSHPLDWVRLNPQPLPPKGHWRAASVARFTIARALDMHETAEALAQDGGTRALGMIQRNVNGLVGNWCGSGVHPRPFPWPWGPLLRGTEPLEPIELIVAGAQFQKAADALEGSTLQGTFEDAADRLFKTGLSRLEEADC